MKRLFLFSPLIALAACGPTKTTTKSSALATETEVLDLRLSEASPDDVQNSEAASVVGFDAAGRENRMLVYFPGIRRLYAQDVIVSSIASIELVLQCARVNVNPDNIRLHPMTRAWTARATWRSPLSLLPGSKWTSAGGDFDTTLTSTPSIATSEQSSKNKALHFDVTQVVTDMIVRGRENFGFVIQVSRSPNNNGDAMTFQTYNAGDSGSPTAILTFTTKDVLTP